jgi:hypothetical protein
MITFTSVVHGNPEAASEWQIHSNIPVNPDGVLDIFVQIEKNCPDALEDVASCCPHPHRWGPPTDAMLTHKVDKKSRMKTEK